MLETGDAHVQLSQEAQPWFMVNALNTSHTLQAQADKENGSEAGVRQETAGTVWLPGGA